MSVDNAVTAGWLAKRGSQSASARQSCAVPSASYVALIDSTVMMHHAAVGKRRPSSPAGNAGFLQHRVCRHLILDRLDNRAFDVSAFFFDDRPQRAWQSFAKRFWQEHLASLLGIDVAERLHGLVPVRGVLAGVVRRSAARVSIGV